MTQQFDGKFFTVQTEATRHFTPQNTRLSVFVLACGRVVAWRKLDMSGGRDKCGKFTLCMYAQNRSTLNKLNQDVHEKVTGCWTAQIFLCLPQRSKWSFPHFHLRLLSDFASTVCTAGISEDDYPSETVDEPETACRVMNRVRDEREMWRRGGFYTCTHTHTHTHTHTRHPAPTQTYTQTAAPFLSWFSQTVNRGFIRGALWCAKDFVCASF